MKTDFPLNELSVFFPCYNEEANVKETVDKAIPIIQKTAAKWEIVLVNDGSKDGTAQVLETIKQEHPNNTTIVTHNPNRGYGAAFKSGIYNSKYEWIAFTDSDGQFDFAEISYFIDKQKQTNADLVIGYYIKRQVPASVVFTSKVWELIVFVLFGLRVTDIDCGFKFFRKKVVDTIPRLQAERGAFISSEFLIKSKKSGFKIVEIPIHHYPRAAGQATGRALNVIIKSFIDLFKLWYKINFATSTHA